MKEDKTKKWERFWSSILLITFVIYTSVFIMTNLGYYEYASYKRKTITEEQIKKFEEDVKNGKEIDVNDYLVFDELLYANKKRLGLKLSEGIGTISKKFIVQVFKFLNKLIEEE